ncbi:unnamed protein product [Linum trigynum]|uniref:Secreted protein n=1 Tax=Linum trigynum TaxID=586398 RepID=A0AAV2F2N3_9ROSI
MDSLLCIRFGATLASLNFGLILFPRKGTPGTQARKHMVSCSFIAQCWLLQCILCSGGWCEFQNEIVEERHCQPSTDLEGQNAHHEDISC